MECWASTAGLCLRPSALHHLGLHRWSKQDCQCHQSRLPSTPVRRRLSSVRTWVFQSTLCHRRPLGCPSVSLTLVSGSAWAGYVWTQQRHRLSGWVRNSWSTKWTSSTWRSCPQRSERRTVRATSVSFLTATWRWRRTWVPCVERHTTNFGSCVR